MERKGCYCSREDSKTGNNEEQRGESVMAGKLVQGPYQCSSSTSVINSQVQSFIAKLLLS